MNEYDLIKNIEDGHNKRPDISKLYAPWGEQGIIAQQQGWYPESAFNDVVRYRAGYRTPFDTIIIPGQDKPGHVTIIGGYSGKFDVVIEDAQGKTLQTILKGSTPYEVQRWITSPNNTVAGRVQQLKGTDQQFTVR